MYLYMSWTIRQVCVGDGSVLFNRQPRIFAALCTAKDRASRLITCCNLSLLPYHFKEYLVKGPIEFIRLELDKSNASKFRGIKALGRVIETCMWDR